jgi:hypothetical protein
MPTAYYRFEANVIGRSTGKQSSRSVVFASAYRAGEKMIFEKEGVEADYTGKRGILETGIMAPANAPSWMADRPKLWNEVEAVEKRKDAQLARELLIAFPAQLSDDQRRDVLTEFLASEVVSKGMVADYAIHAPGKGGDERNHHAHVLLTMREITDDGFGNKRREWNSPELLRDWREEWANTLNRMFERHRVTDAQGELYRVDHRSYEDQGLEKEPGVHLGPAATALERRGIPTERGDINREIYGRNDELQFLRRQAEHIQAEVLQLQEELKITPRHVHRGSKFFEDIEQQRQAENDNDFDFSL